MENKSFSLESFEKQLTDLNLDLILRFFEKDKIPHTFFDERFEKTLEMQKAIFKSMTAEEKRNPDILNPSRLTRIANGSGTKVSDIERLLKQYRKMKKMMSKLRPNPSGNEPPPAKSAVMPIPKEPEITQAIGRKYGT